MISFDGLSNLVSALQNKTANIAEEALDIISYTGEDIFNDSQQLVPELTGELRGSGDISEERTATTIHIDITYGDGNGYGSKYGIADGYSWFQELGTSKMGAQPYLEPPFDENTGIMMDRLEDLISQ